LVDWVQLHNDTDRQTSIVSFQFVSFCFQ
jgi:hypothetical protein